MPDESVYYDPAEDYYQVLGIQASASPDEIRRAYRNLANGVESAIRQAQQVAGAKGISVGGANVAQQCIRLGLLDELQSGAGELARSAGAGSDPFDVSCREIACGNWASFSQDARIETNRVSCSEE